MTPKAYVSHSVKGRVRIQIPQQRRNANYFEQLKAKMLNLPGVDSVRTNSLTGSVLIKHNADWSHVVQHAANLGLYVLAGTVEELAEQDRLKAMAGETQVDELTIHRVSFVTLLALAGVQVVRGELLGPASTLLSGALSAWTKMRDTEDRRTAEIENIETPAPKST